MCLFLKHNITKMDDRRTNIEPRTGVDSVYKFIIHGSGKVTHGVEVLVLLFFLVDRLDWTKFLHVNFIIIIKIV
jgi:hypothetical protein